MCEVGIPSTWLVRGHQAKLETWSPLEPFSFPHSMAFRRAVHQHCQSKQPWCWALNHVLSCLRGKKPFHQAQTMSLLPCPVSPCHVLKPWGP